MTKEKIIETLRLLKKEIKEKYKTEIKGIFGSYARDQQTEQSDIDILVDFEPNATLIDVVGAEFYLQEKLNTKIDIVSNRALKQEIKNYITEDIIVI